MKPTTLRRHPSRVDQTYAEEKTMNAKNVIIAGAAAALLLTGAVTARADQSAGGSGVKCLGLNDCKGHGACATAQNDCKGKNACKGQGAVVMSSADECTAKGGSVAQPPEKK
jgi:hypothetical protein